MNLTERINQHSIADIDKENSNNILRNQINRLNYENRNNIDEDKKRRKDREQEREKEKEKENNSVKNKINLLSSVSSAWGAVTTSNTTSFPFLRNSSVTSESQRSQKSRQSSVAASLRSSIFGIDQNVFSSDALGK